MKKHLQSTLAAVGIVAALGVVQAVPAVAAERDTAVRSATNLSDTTVIEALIDRADPFVSSGEGGFVLDAAGAATVLTADEITYVQKLIASSNDTVNAAVAKGAAPTVSASSITLTARTAAALAFTEGVTKVEAYWYGFRVWLSKDTLRAIGGGVGIGGLWVPEPIASKVLASLGGAVAAFAPGGVVFNYTPVPAPGFPLGVVWGQEWQ